MLVEAPTSEMADAMNKVREAMTAGFRTVFPNIKIVIKEKKGNSQHW